MATPQTLTSADLINLPISDLLARMIFGEARGEGEQGMLAVAHVALNRASHPGWWGKSLAQVIVSPLQFSCFNPNSTELPEILDLDADAPSSEFSPCLTVAEDVLAGTTTDPTGGATAYLNPAECKHMPSWATQAAYTCTIGKHHFYKLPV